MYNLLIFFLLLQKKNLCNKLDSRVSTEFRRHRILHIFLNFCIFCMLCGIADNSVESLIFYVRYYTYWSLPLPVCLYVCLSLFLCVFRPVFLFIYKFLCRCLSLFVCLSVCLSPFLFFCLSVSLSQRFFISCIFYFFEEHNFLFVFLRKFYKICFRPNSDGIPYMRKITKFREFEEPVSTICMNLNKICEEKISR